MSAPKQSPLSPTAATGQQMLPIQAIRQDTGDPIWLVQSDSDPGAYVLLVVKGESVECLCRKAQLAGACDHVAAVHLANQEPKALQNSSLPVATATLYPHPEPRNEQERRQIEAADRRDRALLWTDDQPFSIFKS